MSNLWIKLPKLLTFIKCQETRYNVAREDETNRKIVIRIVARVVVDIRSAAIVGITAIQAVAIVVVLDNCMHYQMLAPEDGTLLYATPLSSLRKAHRNFMHGISPHTSDSMSSRGARRRHGDLFMRLLRSARDDNYF